MAVESITPTDRRVAGETMLLGVTRTASHRIYIRNFRPDRWPNGVEDYRHAAIPGCWYADCDNGPTKSYMIEHRDQDATHRRLFDLAFSKRPAEELYDLGKDPNQLHNLADSSKYAAAKSRLAALLMGHLRDANDPRAIGDENVFEKVPYLGGGVRHPNWRDVESPKP